MRGTVSVRRAYSEIRGQGMVVGPPKSRARVRTIALPRFVRVEVTRHLEEFVGLSHVIGVSPGLPASRSGEATSTTW